MWMRRQSGRAGGTIFQLTGDIEGTFWQKWGGGVVASCFFLYFAITAFAAGTTELTGRYGATMELTGPDARAKGFLFLSIALYLFTHYFLANTRLYIARDIGKVIALLGIIASIGFIGIRAALF